MKQEAVRSENPRGMNVSSSTPTRILRLEAALLAGMSLLAYDSVGGAWGLYFGVWLLPDLAIALYLINPRVGSVAYNCTHNLFLPALLCGVGLFFEPGGLWIELGLIWFSHVTIDRAFGFGLKYATFFKDTHLSRT